ncbi:MAG: phosphoribosylformylglycinamidine synthase II, partial [Myxococcales bacterium]|nr:phosphoribosylformylglycinamidine synthase II [Myxococcales bacterium]
PYELMLSESQERMLICAHKGREREIIEIYEKWDLDAVVIGEVTDDGIVRLQFHGQEVAAIPAAPLSEEAPRYERPMARPKDLAERQSLDLGKIEMPGDWNEALARLLAAPNLCSKRSIWRRYDHSVRTNTVVLPGADAAVIRIKESGRALAMACDCNSRYVYLDPFLGAAHAVAEAARNVTMVGAEPIALTDCLNFGNPERPEIMWQFAEACRGISAACEALGVPVVSGNVSLYNETEGVAIQPTPTIGMVGLLDSLEQVARMEFRVSGNEIVLIGEATGALGGSEYLSHLHGLRKGKPPALDLEREAAMQRVARAAIRNGWVRSAHDIADGGLAVALAECCMGDEAIGASVDVEAGDARVDELLFGEGPARAILSVAPDHVAAVLTLARESGVPAARIGTVGGDRLQIGEWIDTDVAALRERWERTLR